MCIVCKIAKQNTLLTQPCAENKQSGSATFAMRNRIVSCKLELVYVVGNIHLKMLFSSSSCVCFLKSHVSKSMIKLKEKNGLNDQFEATQPVRKC